MKYHGNTTVVDRIVADKTAAGLWMDNPDQPGVEEGYRCHAVIFGFFMYRGLYNNFNPACFAGRAAVWMLQWLQRA